MKKGLGGIIVIMALVIGIVPFYTDCLAQGRELTTTTGMLVPMKCHWSALAELTLAVPLGLLGLLHFTVRGRESGRIIGLMTAVISLLVILVPTLLFGVCSNPMMTCNMIMRPILVFTGTLAGAAGLVTLISSRGLDEPGLPG